MWTQLLQNGATPLGAQVHPDRQPSTSTAAYRASHGVRVVMTMAACMVVTVTVVAMVAVVVTVT